MVGKLPTSCQSLDHNDPAATPNLAWEVRLTYPKRTVRQHFADAGPKRILALDGGGLRGILTLGILKKVEDELSQRHGSDASFRLCDYFDLISGTSTGAIIAATLAIGWSVEDITKKYFELGSHVFQRSLLRQGLLRAKYDETRLIEQLQSVFGADTTLGSDNLQTGLLVVIKRLDSGSPWPVSNNPNGKYFRSREGGVIGNGDYKLWQAVRASTAAPDYFDPERVAIAESPASHRRFRRRWRQPIQQSGVPGVSLRNAPWLPNQLACRQGQYSCHFGRHRNCRSGGTAIANRGGASSPGARLFD